VNLNVAAGAAVAAVNPAILGTVKLSTGNTTNPDYSRSPTYTTVANVPMQVQPVSPGLMAQLASLNIQGVMKRVYVNMDVEGIERVLSKGGDLLIFSGQTWKVVHPLEEWSTGWSCVIVSLQDGA
jgi:hypothetical protein